MTSTLSEQDQDFMKKLEEELKDRYTDKDEEFMKVFNAAPSTPPIMPWQHSHNNSNRRFDYRKRGYDNSSSRYEERGNYSDNRPNSYNRHANYNNGEGRRHRYN